MPTPCPRRRALALLALPALLLAADPAAAHQVDLAADGLVSGLLHPMLGPDHLIAMVAVGLWGAQLGMPLIVALPVAFPLVMALGGLLGVAGLPLPAVEIGIATSALLLGLAVAFAFRAPVWAAVTLITVFAIFHGHAHGTELPEAADALPYGIGFVVATGLLHVLGIVIGMLNDWQGETGPRIVRGLGGVVALMGGYFLIGAMA